MTGTGTINVKGLADRREPFVPQSGQPVANPLRFGSSTLNLNMSTPASNGGLGVGYLSSGTLTIQTPISSTYGYLGFLPGSSGTATVSGSGTWTMSQSMLVGDWGTGTLNILNGGQVTIGRKHRPVHRQRHGER